MTGPSDTPSRYHALDSLRAAMMFLGIYLHVVAAYSPSGGWPLKPPGLTMKLDWSMVLIHVFRMPVFYAMAGFFTALLLQRDGFRRAAWNRSPAHRRSLCGGLDHRLPPHDIPHGVGQPRLCPRGGRHPFRSLPVEFPSDASLVPGISDRLLCAGRSHRCGVPPPAAGRRATGWNEGSPVHRPIAVRAAAVGGRFVSCPAANALRRSRRPALVRARRRTSSSPTPFPSPSGGGCSPMPICSTRCGAAHGPMRSSPSWRASPISC